jgi:hypothetical protein
MGDPAFRRWALVALTLLLLLTVANPAPAADRADAAGKHQKRKKICKKKRKKGIPCKPQAPTPVPMPVYQPPPGELVMTWDSTANLDLHAFDGAGNHTGLQNGVVVNGIPGTTYTGDDDGYGPETIPDPQRLIRGFMICYQRGPGALASVTQNGGSPIRTSMGPSPSGDVVTLAVGYGSLPSNARSVCGR